MRKTNKRLINEIIVHCSATPAGREVTVEQMRHWHVAGRGWRDIGYHYIVHLDGKIDVGRPVEQVGAHCRGHNRHSIGVCYIGGLGANGKPADTRTNAQREALSLLIHSLRQQYPGAIVHGHREFAAKACPCFDAYSEYNEP